MVKGDKRSKVFRDRILLLNEFGRSSCLPEVRACGVRFHPHFHLSYHTFTHIHT